MTDTRSRSDAALAKPPTLEEEEVFIELDRRLRAESPPAAVLVFLNVPAMPQPKIYLGGAGEVFDRH